MKTHCTILATPTALRAALLALFTLHPSLFTLAAAIPLAWEARPGNPAPVMFDRYHGETLELSATLRGFGELPFAPGADVRLWYQTNGMGAAWWSAPAAVSSNVISATWSPEMDPGAERVSLFFGAPSNAYAAAVLRLRHSPGFAPASLPLPVPVLDFSAVELRGLAALTNGWSFGSAADLTPSTNYTDAALGAFAATGSVARAASYGTPTRWTDATGCVWQVVGYGNWTQTEGAEGFSVMWFSEDDLDYFYTDQPGWYIISGVYYPLYGGDADATEVSGYPDPVDDEEMLDSPVTFVRSPPGTNLVGRVALTNDIPDTASITDDIAAIRAENALVYRLYSGSNVVAEVTNYNSRVHAPELRLMQLNESNEYVTVWAETNGLARVRREANAYTDAATGAVARAAAPRAWSKTTSALGADAPEGVTWVSTPTVVVAGGLEYAKHVTSAGAVWVLASNGLVADVAGSTNAFFRIADASGTNVLFAVERTESLSIGVDASNIVVAAVGDGNDVAIQIPVVSREHPVCYAATNLTDWAAVEQGAEPEWIGMCEWNGEPGAWEFIAGGVVAREAFFRFMVEQEGSTVIRHAAATDISAGIVVNGTNFVPKVTGNTLTWEKAQ